MSVRIEGLDDIEHELDDLVKHLEQKGGEVPMDQLFTKDFMQSYTEFESLEEFFAASPWRVESDSDFEDLPRDEFDSYVDTHTDFDSWDSMLQAGGREYFLREAAHR